MGLLASEKKVVEEDDDVTTERLKVEKSGEEDALLYGMGIKKVVFNISRNPSHPQLCIKPL